MLMESAYDVIMTSLSYQYFWKRQFSFILRRTITTPNLVRFGSTEAKFQGGGAESPQVEKVLNEG